MRQSSIGRQRTKSTNFSIVRSSSNVPPLLSHLLALSTPGSLMLIGVPTLVSVDCWWSESLRLAVGTELDVEVSGTDSDGPTTASRVLALAQASLAATSLALLSCILLLVLQ